MNEPLLGLTGLAKSYPGVAALKQVSFTVAPRQIHALLGENGAGKSTLIRLLSGVEAPDKGSMQLAGQTYRPTSPLGALRQGVSTVYQEQSLLTHRTVVDNILLGAESRRWRVFLDRRVNRQRTGDALDRVGAGHINPTSTVGSLSTADRQMVDIARALLRDSRLLVLDEPTAALTAREVDALFDVIAGLPALDISVLLVSHRLDEIFRICDAVTVLRDGRHVHTSALARVDREQLITAMVGEDVQTTVPEWAPEERQILLKATELSGRTFRDVALEVVAGEVLAITGITGSGKEELAEVLYGGLPVVGGTISVGGRSVRMTPRTAIPLGVVGVPGDRSVEGVIADLSVARNLALPSLARLTRLGFVRRAAERALADRRVAELAIKVPSSEVAVAQLSGGNQQKVALGKWLELAPRVLVLVEPTQGIDVKVRYEFYRLIRTLATGGSGVVLICSDLPEVLTLADRTLVLRHGRMVGVLDRASATSEALVQMSFGDRRQSPGEPSETVRRIAQPSSLPQPAASRPSEPKETL